MARRVWCKGLLYRDFAKGCSEFAVGDAAAAFGLPLSRGSGGSLVASRYVLPHVYSFADRILLRGFE